MNFIQFLKNKGVVYAVILAIFYQAAMVGLYIYGYHVLPGGVDKLSVNIVNQDGSQGAAILKELTANLPFQHVTTNQTLDKSKEALNNRSIQMVMVIPKDFVGSLANGTSEFNFYINESNTITTVTTMEEVAQSITERFNQAVNQEKLAGVLSSMHLSDAQQAAIAGQTQNTIVQKNIYINKAPQTMNYIMAPTFLSIGTYASSMVVAIVLMNIFLAFIPIIGKWKAFRYIEIAGCVIMVLAPLCGLITARLLLSINIQTLLLLYLQQMFMQLASFQLALVFSLLLGQNGIFINILLMLSQTIAGGGTMALQIMPSLFQAISYITPMYPNTQIDFGLMYGGPILTFEYRILAILLVSFLALLAIVRLKWPDKERRQQAVEQNAIGRPATE